MWCGGSGGDDGGGLWLPNGPLQGAAAHRNGREVGEGGGVECVVLFVRSVCKKKKKKRLRTIELLTIICGSRLRAKDLM